ncbi:MULTISPECIES: hypothetical protein [unclassified Oceanispirochaeta]|uniref:hypothetical protein n=1 Tax=unclassified Oceanispirochaeta TaxID=2635722 RepID=UPI000E096615|nr:MULTISPECIES: hypothetical protein [unclassified Oceanispirochaeta]MBF9015780.1 hypothetical protein [Oceanispirochaeta sp. M2]NPD72243.1 hypothetical protein [Oceanispirochaeta sp. M1]RDG32340.1 hypothetical protein DV872_09040 [Oceanispirochaeta sp. M1]
MKEKPTPRDGDSRTRSWQEYRHDLTIIIDSIILLYPALSLIIGIFPVFQADSIFIKIVINLSFAALFLSTYISRKHIADHWRVILLNLPGKIRTLKNIMVF